MAERRSSFRFRLPWSQAAPPSPPTPARQPSTRPSASASPARSQQSTSSTNVASAETPSSNPTKNTTPTSSAQSGTQNNKELPKTSTIPSPSASPPRPIEPSTTTTSSPAPATPTTADSPAETETPVQPSNMNSTSTNSSAPKIAQRPPFRPAGAASSQSPPPKNQASRNEPQPSSPTNKSRITSQPASPSGTATNSRVPQSPSPSRSSPAMTPTSSPTRKSQVLLSSKANQESSNYPFVVNSQMQEKNQAITRPTSAPKSSLQEISKPSSKSTEALSRNPDKEVELQTKKETKSDAVSEGNVSFRDKAMQPSEVSVHKSGVTRITSEPKMLKESASNNEETKGVKEAMQELKGKDNGSGVKTSDVQSKQAHTTVKQDEILKNLVPNGRQTRRSTSQPRNKTMVSGSSQKSNEPHIPLQKEIKDKVFNRTAVGDGKQQSTGVNVITLAGDNRGASMQLGSDSSRKGGAIHINRGRKVNPDETTDGEGRRSKDACTMEDQTIAAYVNCNVQGINNSILFNSSITERNPGAHMSLPRMPSEPVQSSEKTGSFEAHKAKFSVTPARTIRRRCLRGLFLDLSDSDPEKPRRHGCRVGCKEKVKITK